MKHASDRESARFPRERRVDPVPVRKWIEQDRVNNTKDRSVCANAKRECKHGNRGHTRMLQQHSNAILQVLEECSCIFHPRLHRSYLCNLWIVFIRIVAPPSDRPSSRGAQESHTPTTPRLRAATAPSQTSTDQPPSLRTTDELIRRVSANEAARPITTPNERQSHSLLQHQKQNVSRSSAEREPHTDLGSCVA